MPPGGLKDGCISAFSVMMPIMTEICGVCSVGIPKLPDGPMSIRMLFPATLMEEKRCQRIPVRGGMTHLSAEIVVAPHVNGEESIQFVFESPHGRHCLELIEAEDRRF